MVTLHDKLRSIVDNFRPELKPFEDHYRHFHENPELGTQEERTSEIAASHLKANGYEVITRIGGYGVVGVLKNGEGPTVLLRADMDALPIQEVTGLPYASKVEAIDTDGDKKPVMHACGHDSHVASMMGTSTLLAKAKDKWSGTLIVLFQPDEEHVAGARAMLHDGLYQKVPKPHIVLGQHLINVKTGVVLIKPGPLLAANNTLKVTVFGRAAHSARPQDSIDPIVLAAHMIVRLQTVVAREIGPLDAASVTCAYIHGGKAHNVIPDEVEFMLNIRTFSKTVRDKVLDAVTRIIKAEAIASGVKKEPEIVPIMTCPPTDNDPEAALKIESAFKAYFGEERTWEPSQNAASEDFSLLATDIGVPYVMWLFGGVDPKTWAEFERTQDRMLISSPHQADYAPVVQPTLKTGIEAMSLAALTFLNVDR